MMNSTSCITTHDWNNFGPKRRWNANDADIALGPVYKERGSP